MKFNVSLELNEQAIRKAAEKLAGATRRVHQHRATVGINEGEDAEEKVNYEGQPTATRLVEVAAIQELAEGRPFIRNWFDSKVDEHKREMTAAMRAEYEEENEGALEVQVAAWAEELKNYVASGEANLKGLTPRTIAEREKAGLSGEPPLYATGQLVHAITGKLDGNKTG